MSLQSDAEDALLGEKRELAQIIQDNIDRVFGRIGTSLARLHQADEVSSEHLAALRDRLKRVLEYMRELLPDPEPEKSIGFTKRRKKARQRDEVAASQRAGTMLAEIRGLLDEIENVIARALPHRSSGSVSYKFGGRRKMSRQEGAVIRADAKVMSRHKLMKKWCLDKAEFGKGGYEGGQGAFTVFQVAAALAQDSGGHRRRRGIA